MPRPPPGPPRPPTLSGQAGDADFAAVGRHAEDDGEVRVIVGLRVAFTPDGEQDPAATVAQRAAVRRAQDRVVAALAGTDHTVDRRLDSVPQLVVTLFPSDGGGAATVRSGGRRAGRRAACIAENCVVHTLCVGA